MMTNTPPVTNGVTILPQNATNLNDSPELLRSPVLDSFVASMGNDPVALANFVINQVDLTDPMDYSDDGNVSEQAIYPTGVSRGALGTFMEREGSPIDQCALLVYLLRQAGVPAVYQFPPSGGMKILTERLSEMFRFQIQGAYNEAGQLYTTNTMITVNYPWVAAYIGTNWVNIFPWLKDYEVTEGLNLWDEMPPNYYNAFPFVHDYIYGNTNLLSLASGSDDTLRVIFPAYLKQTLLQNHPGVSVGDIGTQIVNRQHYYARWQDFPTPTYVTNTCISLESLGSSSITNINPALTNIFDTLSVEIYSLNDPTKDIQTGQMPLTALHNREFYIYQTATNGNEVQLSLILAPFNTNTITQSSYTNDVYLTNKEVLSMTLDQYDNQLNVRFKYYRNRAISAAYAIDPYHTFLGLISSGGAIEERPIYKGDEAAICLSYGRVTPEMLNVHAANLWNMQNELSLNPSLTNTLSPDLYIGEPMYLAGMNYYENVGNFSQVNQNLNKVSVLSSFAMGLSKISPARDSSGNLTNNTVYPVFPNVDMLLDDSTLVGNGTVQPNSGQDILMAQENYELLRVVDASAEEHQVINTFYGQTNAVSTVRLLQLAQSSGSNIVSLNINNFNSQASTIYQGQELSQWDTQLWSDLVSDFSDTSTYGFLTAYVTPGPEGNSSYQGMGALVLGWDQWAAEISPESLNGGFGTPFQLTSVTPGNTPYYNLANNNNNSFTLSFNQPEAGTVLAPTTEPNFAYASTESAILNGEYSIGTFDTSFASSVNSVYGNSTSGETPVQAFASADQSSAESGFLGDVDEGISQALTDVGDPVQPISGEFYIDTTDLRIPGPLPLSLRRNYSSQNLADNQFGTGWKLSIMPYLSVAMGETNIYAADMDGAVLAYVQTATNANIWTPTLAANPQLNNNTAEGAGGMVNRLRDRLVQSVSGTTTNYTLYGCDGSVRTFQTMTFNNGDLNQSRPYLLNWTDSRGNYYNFSYGTNASQTSFGQMTRILCSNGNYLDFDYDVYGHIVDAYTGDGRWVYYTYDEYNDLVSVTLPDNSTRSYDYLHSTQAVTNNSVVSQVPYSTHLIVEEDKPDGRELVNEYDSQRRVTNQLSTAGSDLNPIPTASFTYFNNFNLTNSYTNGISGYTYIVDGNGNTNRYDYTNSLITKVTYPLGLSIQQTWYPDNATSPGYPRSVATRTDKRGMVTQYEYDSSGNVTNMVSIGDITGDGITNQTATNTAAYSPVNNLPVEILDAVGNGMEYVYDPTFTYMPQQTIRLAGGVPISTNFMYYGNATNVVQDGNISQTNMAFGLLTREVRAYNSPDSATNATIYDGQGFPDETIAYTGTGDPSITNTYFYNERGMMVDSVDALGAVTFCDYDPMNRPTETENFDEFGNPLSLVLKYYNENGELNWTEGPQYNPDEYVYYDYDGAGRLTTKIQWLSQANSDGSGVSAPSGYNLYAQSFYQYDPLGDLTLAVDPRGAETTNTYDALCRLVSSTHLDTDGQTVLSVDGYSYEPGGEVQTHTNALGGVTTMYYTITGKPEYEINADGSTNGWRYYPDGRVKREIQGNGAYWQTAYDDIDRITTRVFYSAAGVAEATNAVYYDRRGNPIQKVDAAFYAFDTTYDGLDRVKSAAGPAIVTVTEQETINFVDSFVTNVLQQSLTNYYDAAGRNVTNINDHGEMTVTTSDAIGRVTATKMYSSSGKLIRENYTSYSPDNNSVTTTNGSGASAIVNTAYVDTEGHNVLSISYPTTGAMDYTWKTYDLAGNLTYQEQDSSSGDTTTGWEGAIFDYDGLNRCIEKVDRNNAVTTYAYDQLGDLTNRTMPGNLVWQASYNGAGQELADEVSGGGQSTRNNSYTYYSGGTPDAGMLDTKTDGRGNLSTFSYDDWLRPTSITRTLNSGGSIPPLTLYGGPTTITVPGSGDGYNHLDTFYGYDARGYATNITEQYTGSATGPDPKVILRTFDPYGQLSSESISINSNGFSTAYQTWDSVGRRTGLNINGANYMYGWHPDGTLMYASSPNGSGFYSYNTAGLLTNRLVGARSTAITSLDGEGRPTTEITSVYGTAQLTENMTWNGDGTLASHVLYRPDFTDSRQYQYNDLSRRLSYEQQNINLSTTWTNDFLYDNGADTMGVLTAMGQPGSANWNGGVSPLEQVNSETNTTTTYPATGRLNGGATLAVTLDGQPLAVSTNSSGDPSYPFQWRAVMELVPGTHQLKVAALHPSGAFTAWATNTFTNNFGNETDAISRDGNGNVVMRTWYNSDGLADNVQYFFFDSKNRLTDLFDYDRSLNGYYVHSEYDGLDRRLLTQCYTMTNAVIQFNPTTIGQYYDPMVEFQEVGVSYGNTIEWKLLGPDLNGQYGGENGTGGFDGVSPGLNLFYPTISDFRGNILGEITNGAIAWNSARPTGYGAVPGYRPVALGHGADLVQSSAWRGRWVDITGYYNIGERLYDPVTGMWLSYDPTWNERDPNYLSFCGGDPIMGFDPDGRFTRGSYQAGVGMVEGGATLVWDLGGAIGYDVVSPFNEQYAEDTYGSQIDSIGNMANGFETLANQAENGQYSQIGTELTGGANQSAAYRAGYAATMIGALFTGGGEAGDAGEIGDVSEAAGDAGEVSTATAGMPGEAGDVSAQTTAAASMSSEPAEEATIAAEQSGQMIEEPAEVPAPNEEVPVANAAAAEGAQAPAAIPAATAAVVSDVADVSSAITDPAQMLQAPSEAATQTFYRGDQAGLTSFQSYAAQSGGVGNSEAVLANGNLNDLMASHAINSASPPSPFISVTTDINVAKQFAGPNGAVYKLQLAPGRAILNTQNPLAESEWLVPHQISPNEIIGTVPK
jgi:RHS repeat-associated protein